MIAKTPRNGALPLIVVLGVITAFDAMAIDMYLPGFRDIGLALGADAGAMQMSLSVFVGGLAAGQLFYGPLTDRFGRRGPLAFGILLFIVASILAALSTSTSVFMTARALQGLGAAAGLVIPRAIITDRFEGREVGKLFSALLQVMMIAPVIAPPVGGVLLAALGWQSVFWILALIGTASLVALFRIVPESLEPSKRNTTGLQGALRNYASLIRQGRLMALMLSSAFAMAGLFVYIGASSFVFVDHFGLSPVVYSLVLAGVAVGMVIGGQVNVLLLGRYSERDLLMVGLCLFTASAAVIVGATVWLDADVLMTGVLILIAMVGLTFVLSNGIALVMHSAPVTHIGSASSLLGVLQYVFAGVTGGALAIAFNGSLLPFTAVLTISACGSLIAFLTAERLPVEEA